MLGKLLGWYFSRTMLPYWVLVVFDGFQCFFGGLFFLWLLHPASELLSMWPGLLHTWVAFLTCSLIGFRVFHTYSGILRYSQFIDLLRVCCAGGLSLLLAMVFMYLCRRLSFCIISICLCPFAAVRQLRCRQQPCLSIRTYT